MKVRRWVIWAATLVVVAGVSAACGGDSYESPASSGGGGVEGSGAGGGIGADQFGDAFDNADMGSHGSAGSSVGTTVGGASEPAPIGAPVSGIATSSVDVPEVGAPVVKNADLSIEVKEGAFKDAVRDAIGVAERYSGFVVTTDVADRDNGLGSVVIRVPARSFEAALGDLHDLGDLNRETISGIDVSQDFIDLRARLENLQSQKAALKRLMDEATSVDETLRVQSELQRVQVDIEQLKGRIRYLNDQADLGTIRVEVVEAGAVPTKVGALERSWQRALTVATNVLSAVILGAGFVIPMAILLAVVLLLLSRLRPRLAGGLDKP
jgi:hypothetical protein